MVYIICFPIQCVHIFRSCRRMPVNIQTSGIRRNGINVGKKWISFLWRGFSCEDNNCVPSYEHHSHLYIGFQSSMDTLYFMNNGAVIHFFLKKKGKKR